MVYKYVYTFFGNKENTKITRARDTRAVLCMKNELGERKKSVGLIFYIVYLRSDEPISAS